MSLTNDDLYKNQYNYETLKTNIYAVSLLDILKTQQLTGEFCIKYILNPNFQLSEQDEKITIELVKFLQPHISDEDFLIASINADNKKSRKQRIDSFEDFESFSNKSK